VYIVTGGAVERRSVSVGGDMAGFSEILSGVSEGDSVIVSGTSMIREGAKARIVEPLGDQIPPGKAMDSSATALEAGNRGGRKGRGA
jgi:hypothetical protein